jgi:hypothetical protein
MILIFAIFDWFPRRKPCAGVSHDGAETSPNEDLFLGCYLLADGISAAARKKWRLRYITILWAAPRRSAHGEPCEEAQEGLAKDSLHGSLPRPVFGGSGFLLRDGAVMSSAKDSGVASQALAPYNCSCALALTRPNKPNAGSLGRSRPAVVPLVRAGRDPELT